MGIPSYFSYIVKNYPEIITKFSNFKIDNLYLDCNSIIYDLYYQMLKEESVNSVNLIKNVCIRIEYFIQLIKPLKRVMIAFDGVAPVAKLEQQRSRRYKSSYQTEITRQIHKKPVNSSIAWNTAAITPGTQFMTDLSNYIKIYFGNPEKFHLETIINSTSDIYGEGEHKIFEYMRLTDHSEDTTIIYGLDADLIMLSINHLPICPNIYLFRETPHFIQSIDKNLEPCENYVLDIPLLTKSILLYMNNDNEILINQNNKIYDYIFLSFMLGNDFLPHFPAINIRTGGMDKLLNAYKATIKENESLINDKKINWNHFRKVIQWLSTKEEEYLLEEYKLRSKKEKLQYPTDTPDNIFKKFEALPTYERDVEKYINPFKEYWQSRYYKSLFDIRSDITGIRKKDICINYMEGLEWTMKYYTSGCADWRWCYKYNYPPLLTDLLQYIPVFDTNFVINQDPSPVSPLVQLAYVLPLSSIQLLPEKIYKKLLELHPEWYRNDYEFVWSFCKYFWESNVEMDSIDIGELENIINSL
jgi:5'-3' exonuclease